MSKSTMPKIDLNELNYMDLTNSEEKLMNYLWKLETAFLKDIKAEYSRIDGPATTTLATFLKRLRVKGYVGYKLIGNSRQYYPLVLKEKYYSKKLKVIIDDAFDGCVESFSACIISGVIKHKEDLKTFKQVIDLELKKR